MGREEGKLSLPPVVKRMIEKSIDECLPGLEPCAFFLFVYYCCSSSCTPVTTDSAPSRAPPPPLLDELDVVSSFFLRRGNFDDLSMSYDMVLTFMFLCVYIFLSVNSFIHGRAFDQVQVAFLSSFLCFSDACCV